MLSLSNLVLDYVEIKSVPATHTPYRREMVFGFAENEFFDFVQTVQSGEMTDASLQVFCDKYGTLGIEPLIAGSQVGGYDESKTLMILHFKDTSKETITHYYTLVGLLDNFDLTQTLPDLAAFTPTCYWDYMVLNDKIALPGHQMGFYRPLRGFDTPDTVATPGALIERDIINKMIAVDEYAADRFAPDCGSCGIHFSRSENDAPSTYLHNLMTAAINARKHVAERPDLASDPLLGIHDCARYLMSMETYSLFNPLMGLFSLGDNTIEIRALRNAFPHFDEVTTFTSLPCRDYLSTTRPLGTYGIEETMAQELTLDAIAEMAKVGLRELRIEVDPVSRQWTPTVAIPSWKGGAHAEQIAQKVCKRLSEQFFTKYSGILLDIPMVMKLTFDTCGISEVYINSSSRVTTQPPLGFAFPTYNVPGWSHVLMPADKAAGLSEYVCSYIDRLINA